MKKLYTSILILLAVYANSQTIYNPYQEEMEIAYQQYPNIPKGILEAVSYTSTHFSNITNDTPESCFGLPHVYGVMGLTEDGKGYFKNNLLDVSRMSGFPIEEIKTNVQTNVLAYAASYQFLMDSLHVHDVSDHDKILEILSEIPFDNNKANIYALNCHVYSVLSFLSKSVNQSAYNFPNHNINLVDVFGVNNLEILSSPIVNFTNDGIQNENGTSYTVSTQKTAEYGPALWVATPTCNYSSRNGTAISAVTIHTIQGTYAGAISWAQNCNANVSYHYVVRSSDGQITQMLLEADKGWHVGSENPYTIGIEHDGYVSDPSWYTPALYNASADLCRDITQSGYGINPLRTFFGDATTGINVLGGCTKIKGHQHYPSQTHTDPGINWDWEGFYKLINNNPTYTTYTIGSGSLYDSGGAAGNYSDDERKLYLIQPLGAGSVTLSFSAFDIEQDWDYMFIYDGSTPNDPLIGKYTGTNSPGTISSTGGSILLEFRSDCATNKPGWAVTYTSTLPDNTIPTTAISTVGNWKTMDFTATFTDNDNVAVTDSFYQVADFNGTEWRSNPAFGFFNDEFDQTLNADWTNSLGIWAINAGALEQTDEAEGNSNLYTALTQGGTESYLYNWQGQINGSGTNRRAGMHFFCDDPSLNQRGNSYMVYWRVDQDKCQIYEVTANSITLMTDDDIVVDPNIWYDFKIYYNPETGLIKAFLDDVLVSQWTDSTPITSGNSISLRTGNCIGIYDDLKVYKGRNSSSLVTLGSNAEIRYENPNPTTPSGRIASIVLDGNDLWSNSIMSNENIDWTNPSDIPVVEDGVAADIDTTNVGTELSANWSSSVDPNSSISEYFYAIGTSIGGTDVVNWTSNGTNTSVTHTGLSLVAETIYYFSIKAINGAGLYSNIVDSDGQRYVIPSAPPVANFTSDATTICNGDLIHLNNSSTNATSYSWTTTGGTLSLASATNPTLAVTTTGSYTISLTATGPGGTNSTSQTISVTVDNAPVASATQSATSVTLPSGSVTFTNTSTNATSYFWDFGDGNTSATANPTNNYTIAGNYTVMLVAVNNTCPNDTTYFSVSVIDPPVPPIASFTTSNTTICNGEIIQLSNNSTEATSYNWTSTGGSLSSDTATNPTLLITTSGSYNVNLTANGPGGSNTNSQTISVTVVNPPVATATPSATSVTLPSGSVAFTNSSTGATNYFWDFGDGNTSTAASPTNNYTLSGTYTVMLVAINGTCSNDTTYFTINVVDPATPPVANFTSSSNTICAGEVIQLNSTSTDATSLNWATSNGTLSSTSATNPTLAVTGSGSYTVDLTATGPGGTDMTSQTFSITVVDPPVASATPSASSVTLPTGTVSFTNTSTNATSYFWDFGDGNSSAATNPSNTYTTSGTYTVMLIAINGTCSNDTTYFTINVVDPATPPVANFTSTSTTICAGEVIQLNSTSTDATSLNWATSSGTLSSTSATNPTLAVTGSGSYTLDLTATGPGGTDVASQTLTITVVDAPVAAATASSTTVTLPSGTVSFSNTSGNATSYFWSFGDGNSSTNANPTYTYSVAGTYSVMLIASNGTCTDDTTYFTITVEPAILAPIASFSAGNTTICAGGDVLLTNNSINATSYVWSSNGGTFSSTTDFEPTISFTSSGTFTITLTAISSGGTDVVSNSITVTTIAAPIANAISSTSTVTLPNGIVSFTNLSFNSTGYLWEFGDGNTSTDANPWNNFTSAGTYDVLLIASNNDCPDDTAVVTITVIDPATVGIEVNTNNIDWNVYPNPNNGILNVVYTLNSVQDVEIKLFEITGKLITSFSQKSVAGKNISTLDLKDMNLSTGIYTVKISTNNQSDNQIIIFQ